VIFSGVETELYADVREIDEIESIKISIKELNTSDDSGQVYNACVKNISIHSEKYDDEELQRMVMSGELVSDSSTKGSDDSLVALKISAIFLGSSIAIVLFIWGAFALHRRFADD
jgi:hypothetical protein